MGSRELTMVGGLDFWVVGGRKGVVGIFKGLVTRRGGILLGKVWENTRRSLECTSGFFRLGISIGRSIC